MGHILGALYRHNIAERGLNQRRIAPDEHHGARMHRRRWLQLAEILALAVATGDENCRRGHAVQRRHGRAHVRALGVVYPAHAVLLRHQLGAVRQTAEAAHGLDLRRHRHADRVAQRHGGKYVRQVVTSREQHLGYAQQPRFTAHQPLLAGVRTHAVVAGTKRRTEAEMHHAPTRHAHPQHAHVVGIEHHGAVAAEHARLGGGILGQVAVAVHVVGCEIKHRGRARVQAPGGFELETRKLEHVDVGRRLFQQFERGRADVAADQRLQTGGLAHRTGKHRHRALAVGAGDGQYRRGRRARKQLDVADGLRAALDGARDGRFLERNAGAYDQQPGIVEQLLG